jgi:3-dehydroquinate dehydratase-2
MLGEREPEIYGHQTLDQIAADCKERAKALGLEIDFRQSNNEGEIVDWIQAASGTCAGIIINPAAYTHTSIAIMDALNQTACPVIEIHLSNIFQRESFRHHSYISPTAKGIICGFGGHGYLLALEAVAQLLQEGDVT